MTKAQEQRLDFLVKAFREDSDEYKDINIPEDTTGKQQLLRALMNVRMPKPLPKEVLTIQDQYLQYRAEEKGIVEVTDIPTLAEHGSTADHAERISIWQGDITRLATDAIVNAANNQMLGCFHPLHNCIDNCIQTYAGVQLRAECNENMTELRSVHGQSYVQPTAVPMLTDAYNLPCRNIIHIVGPIVDWQLTADLEEDLVNCYKRTLDMCLENNLRSVAFCCISTGVFRFPADRACQIAVSTVSTWLDEHPDAMDRVVFNVFKDEDKRLYENELQ